MLPRPWTRVICAGLTGLLLLGAAAQPAFAQNTGGTRTTTQVPSATFPVEQDAARVREQMMSVLRQYPPSLGRVLRLDPTLFTNDGYMAAYPALTAFLVQHPEVKRSPAFYLEKFDSDSGYYYYRSPSQQMWNDLIGGIGVLLIMIIILSALGWIVRTLIDSRRWHRLSKTQTEVHNKLLDRFTANDELIAYVQSPAGRKFLEAAPINLEGGGRALSAPFSRIIWSIQAGMVAAAAGVGLIYSSSRVDPDAMQPLFTMGVFALSIGVGFVASAVVSYALSRRLGLFDAATTSREHPGA